MLFFSKKKPKKNRILFLVDLENLEKNLLLPSPENLSFLAGFDRLMKEIAREMGEITDVFIFAPPHKSMMYGADLFRAGFFIIDCPKVRDKGGGEPQDTTDDILIRFGLMAIEKFDITHLCLGSGDKDFSPLVRRAIRKGLKIIVAATSEHSLSNELIGLADKVFVFSPTE